VGRGRVVTWVETKIVTDKPLPDLKKRHASKSGPALGKRNCSKANLERMIASGMKNSEIEKELRLSVGYVRKLLIKHGIVNPNSIKE
jgi:hypothetical protein